MVDRSNLTDLNQANSYAAVAGSRPVGPASGATIPTTSASTRNGPVTKPLPFNVRSNRAVPRSADPGRPIPRSVPNPNRPVFESAKRGTVAYADRAYFKRSAFRKGQRKPEFAVDFDNDAKAAWRNHVKPTSE